MNIKVLSTCQNDLISNLRSTRCVFNQCRKLSAFNRNRVAGNECLDHRSGGSDSASIGKRINTSTGLSVVSYIHTSSGTLSQSGNGNKQFKVKATLIHSLNPLKYLSLKIKLFLLRSYFDNEFSEDEFINGAKQAVCFVSEKLAEGKFTELGNVLTPEGVHSGRQLYHQNLPNTSSLRVDDQDFLNISMSDVGFEYGEEGRKWAYILVVCFCQAKESVAKTFGNIDVIATPTRLLRYSFRREYTPGVSGSWFVDKMEHLSGPI